MSAPIWGRFSIELIGVLQLEGVAPMAVTRGEPVAAGGRAPISARDMTAGERKHHEQAKKS